MNTATHVCPCGQHQNPGQLLWANAHRRIVLVESDHLQWLEVRLPISQNGQCQEVLIFATVMPGAQEVPVEVPRIVRPN
jgi:hypothetical protein